MNISQWSDCFNRVIVLFLILFRNLFKYKYIWPLKGLKLYKPNHIFYVFDIKLQPQYSDAINYLLWHYLND